MLCLLYQYLFCVVGYDKAPLRSPVLEEGVMLGVLPKQR
jgi:hypothetical protein